MKIIKIKHSIPENICHFILLFITTVFFVKHPVWIFYNLTNIDIGATADLIITILVALIIFIFLFSQYPIKANKAIFYITIICNIWNTYGIPADFYMYFAEKHHNIYNEEVNYVKENAHYIFLLPMPVYLSAYLNKKIFYTLAFLSISAFIIVIS